MSGQKGAQGVESEGETTLDQRGNRFSGLTQFILKSRDPASEHVESITLYSSDPDFIDSTWHVKNDRAIAIRLDVEAEAEGYRPMMRRTVSICIRLRFLAKLLVLRLMVTFPFMDYA